MIRIYLDHNATSILDDKAKQVMIDFLGNKTPYNPSSIHTDGRKARNILEDARKKIAVSLNVNLAKDDIRIIFTASGTEANNMVVNSFSNLPLLIGATEHVSLLEPYHPEKSILKTDNEGLIAASYLDDILSKDSKIKLVSIMLANNETGVINDIRTLAEIAHKHKAIFHCDASQAYGKIAVDFIELGVDILTISAHKSGGPLGAAALVIKNNLELKALLKGGKQEIGLRAGTENLLAIIGFAEIAKNIEERINKYSKIRELQIFLEEELTKISPEVMILGSKVRRLPNTSSIRMPNIKNDEQLIKFDLAGISLSAGSACSSGRIATSHVLQAMNLDSKIANEVIRASLGPDTTKDEITTFTKQWNLIFQRG